MESLLHREQKPLWPWISWLVPDMKALREIADQYKLTLLCDTAQAPGARVGDKFTGTFADIGGFSLNYHKHIHCGEGGILVTNDDRLAERLCCTETTQKP